MNLRGEVSGGESRRKRRLLLRGPRDAHEVAKKRARLIEIFNRSARTAGPEDQDAVERAELGAAVQAHPRSDSGHGHRRDLGQIELVGDIEQPFVRYSDLVAIGTGPDHTEATATYQYRTAVDVSAGFRTGRPRQVCAGGTDRALRDPHVERIDRCIGDVDECFSGARLRIGELVELESSTDGMKSGCTHRATVGRANAGMPTR